jgi:subtilisin family serine protease
MAVLPASLPKGTSPKGGKGVVIGVIDFGCDFAHPNFCHENGKTRILAIWDQGGTRRVSTDVPYGALYTRDEIDAALSQANPYAALGYGPRPDWRGTHGTHVLDIAAGNGLGTGSPGVAPEADIIFVEAGVPKWSGQEAVENNFGDSLQLIEAVRFIFDRAGDRPCVCNISLGADAGPHDGSSPFDRAMDDMVTEAPNRTVVVAAGNSQTKGIHTSGKVAPNTPHHIVWRQQASGGGEFELWYSGQEHLEVTLVAPDGTRFGPVAPNANLSMATDTEVAIFIANVINDPDNGDHVIGVWIAEGLADGDFVVEVTSTGGAISYHAWLERSRKQPSFRNPVASHTLASLATAHSVIAVGNFDGHKSSFPIASSSSTGPTRDGRNKPDLSAPGQFVWAALSRDSAGVTKKSGTSMAVPAVSGLIALMLSEAARVGANLNANEIRRELIGSASLNPPAVARGGWDPAYGFGRASGSSIKTAAKQKPSKTRRR